jgi:hypothetical protein
MPKGFQVEKRDSLSQGTHTCVLVTHMGDEESVKRIGHLIIPNELADEFISHFEGQSENWD